MMNQTTLLLVGSVLVRCTSAATVTAIGVLNHAVDGTYSRAVAISPDGKLVVGDSRNASGIIDPFRWSASTGMRDLGNPSGQHSYATGVAIKPDGEIVIAGNIGQIARRWTSKTGQWQALPPISECRTPGANALGLNADGTEVWIVGSYDARTGCGGRYPSGYRYNWSSDHGDVDPTWSSSMFTGVARNGAMSGRVNVSGAGDRAVYAAADANPQFVPSLKDVSSQALAISADGSRLAGYFGVGSGDVHAFRWGVGEDTHEDLGVLAGDRSSAVNALSADGRIAVGYSYSEERPAGQTYSAVVWDYRGTHSVMDLLQTGGANLYRWVAFNQVWSVSADGRTICGEGVYDRDGIGPGAPIQMGFVAVIPEPAPALLLIIAAIPLFARKPHST